MDIDIEHKEHYINKEINIENMDIDISNLEVKMKESSMKAKKLFTNIQKLKSCCEYSYTGISDEELNYIISRIEDMNKNYKLKTEELTQLFCIIRKYMENIRQTGHKKEIYKKNIKNVLQLLKQNINTIQNYKVKKESQSIGHLFNYQIDHIRQLKKDIQNDYETDKNCKEIRQVKKLIEQYYQVICERLDYYTNELRNTNDKSKDYSSILNKVYEYKLLYKRLILYIKHYKIINKETMTACENKNANLEDLYQFLKGLEQCLKLRNDHIYTFIRTS